MGGGLASEVGSFHDTPPNPKQRGKHSEEKNVCSLGSLHLVPSFLLIDTEATAEKRQDTEVNVSVDRELISEVTSKYLSANTKPEL